MIKIAIVDDDKHICDMIYRKINAMQFLDNIDYRIYRYVSGTQLINCEKSIDIDIILLDIEMPGLGGLEVAEMLRDNNITSIIIFITSKISYMKEAFGLNIFAFIDKADLKHTLEPILRRCMEYIENNIAVPFKTNAGYITLFKKDIIVAEYDKRKVNIYTKRDKFIVNLPSLARFLAEVNDIRFISVNRVCVINLSYLISTTDNFAHMKDYPNAIPISYERVKIVNGELIKWISKRSVL